ncbi:MAG TPA: Dam family site-specific DNA-(adenine-N6)-methyltransferase [Gemmatimonadaceae bacterium]|nr:Dam family site-specific DNA-(adenine-N6)-methyltransferase [Gemmatimonadaceae bacterium]
MRPEASQRVPVGVKTPPIKLQGIKTKIVPTIRKHVAWATSGRWIEPFLGSGVVLFNLRPLRAIAADTNEHLIRFYQAVQTGELSPTLVRGFLEREGAQLSATEGAHYYEVRTRFNELGSPLDFLFLNRACFNGVMRFNKKGGFNVPFCKKPDRFAAAYITKIVNQVAWVSQMMRGKAWEFVVADWRDSVALATSEDFVYCDPPYNDRHTDYFTRWQSQDVDDLAQSLKLLDGGFAYSTWKGNKYRQNVHIAKHFAEYPTVCIKHFYHVGPTEALRNEMEEALVVAPRFYIDERPMAHSIQPIPEELALFDTSSI